MTLDEYLDTEGAKSPAILAEEIGMSEASLSRIRRGKQNITLEVVRKIIDATRGAVTADGLVFPSASAEATPAFAGEEGREAA